MPVERINKLFIATRGEIAARAGRTCETRRITAVIPYTFSDDNPIAGRMADQHQDDGWKLAPLPGTSQEENYTNRPLILKTAEMYGCDAIFLGYGFLSEDSEFIAMCEKAGMRTLSPSSSVMEAVANKINAREVAKKIRLGKFGRSIPVLEGTGNLSNYEDAVKASRSLGFPVMLKDPNLGGGNGNAVAGSEGELEEAYKRLRARPENTQLFMERFIARAAHVEVQIAADQYGNVITLGERDCTMQRRHQKVVEESPSPRISNRLRRDLQVAAIRFAQAVKYSGVGTWEFLVDLDRKDKHGHSLWYFLEVNPRIQVEHTVTEQQTGLDMVGLMIDIAEGRKLPVTQQDVKPAGHSIQARVYAEDPDKGFVRSEGEVDVLSYPQTEGVRIDTAVEAGDRLSGWYDGTVLKAIAHGADREAARVKLVKILSEMAVAGVLTNRDFLVDLLNTPEFRNGQGTTVFVEQWHQQKLRDRITSLADFINNGTFISHQSSRLFNVGLLPQDIAVPQRRSGQLESYSSQLGQTQRKLGRDSAARFGILERNGIQMVVFELDFGYRAGTVGVQEGIDFTDACRLASGQASGRGYSLPLVTISRSGGARQEENNFALFQMGAAVSALRRFPPLVYINVYCGPVYGGVPASFAGVADFQMAVDSSDTKIGFSGPFIVAKDSGLNPASTKAEDAYAVLPQGTHTPLEHYRYRNVHRLVKDLGEASDMITHMMHIIAPAAPKFRPIESVGLRQAATDGFRFDRPDTLVRPWWGRISSIWHKRDSGKVDVSYPALTNAEKLKMILHGDRPTAADLIDIRSGLFDDAVLLGNPPMHFPDLEQYPPIIAAIASIDHLKIFILAHQTQRKLDPKTGQMSKGYQPQRPEDFEFAQEMISFARKLRLPLLLFGDTNGADCAPSSEVRNQSHRLAKMIAATDAYPNPVLSMNLGMKGSGGGETFIRPFDRAADAENALSFVSTPLVQYWIMTGRWIDDTSEQQQAELVAFINRLYDANAVGRLKAGMIDAIIREGQGGAHLHPQFYAQGIRKWVEEALPPLLQLPAEELVRRRSLRIDRVIEGVSVPRG